MPSRKHTLRSHLAELGVSVEEVSELIHVPISRLVPVVEGKAEADAELLVRLRIFNDEADALRRVDQLRRMRTMSLQGDRHDNVEVPYAAGYVGQDGTAPGE